MEKQFTPDNIQELKENEIFVFGSNLAGNHGAGAAKTALDKFGAMYNVGIGRIGNSYAIPTGDHNFKELDIKVIKLFVDELFNYISYTKDKVFYITEIGCGLTGYTVTDIAPLFKKFEALDNAILPKRFYDCNNQIKTLKVYKMTDKNMQCRGFQYELNKIHTTSGVISICKHGFHSCSTPANCLNYYGNIDGNRLFLCEINIDGSESFEINENIENFTKIATNNIKFLEEIIITDKTFNTGNWNTGIKNTGADNTGNSNTGNRNTGKRNTGNRNTGDYNTGDDNSGSWNTGDDNSGSWNTGDDNSGDRNTGDYNTGDSNTGNYNSGDSNTGNRNIGDFNTGNWNTGNNNTGDFNTEEGPWRCFNIFPDKPRSDYYFPDWLNFNTIEWVNVEEMTEEEKLKNPHYSTNGKYLRSYSYKEAAILSYNKATKEEQRSIEDLPGYTHKLLFKIFGIDRTPNKKYSK